MLSSLVRVHTANGYCSGVLIDPHFILTARHFLRHRTAAGMHIFGERWNSTAVGWIDLPTTDISVLKLAEPAPINPTPLPPEWITARLGDITTSYGVGGGTEQRSTGTVWLKVPQVVGKNLHTRVRHALVVKQPDPAIRGDSGGPVLIDHQLIGLQSMIFDPYGHNLGLSTIALIPPHIKAITKAMSQLQPRPGG